VLLTLWEVIDTMKTLTQQSILTLIEQLTQITKVFVYLPSEPWELSHAGFQILRETNDLILCASTLQLSDHSESHFIRRFYVWLDCVMSNMRSIDISQRHEIAWIVSTMAKL
jgi:hypothetical protein